MRQLQNFQTILRLNSQIHNRDSYLFVGRLWQQPLRFHRTPRSVHAGSCRWYGMADRRRKASSMFCKIIFLKSQAEWCEWKLTCLSVAVGQRPPGRLVWLAERTVSCQRLASCRRRGRQPTRPQLQVQLASTFLLLWGFYCRAGKTRERRRIIQLNHVCDGFFIKWLHAMVQEQTEKGSNRTLRQNLCSDALNACRRLLSGSTHSHPIWFPFLLLAPDVSTINKKIISAGVRMQWNHPQKSKFNPFPAHIRRS